MSHTMKKLSRLPDSPQATCPRGSHTYVYVFILEIHTIVLREPTACGEMKHGAAPSSMSYNTYFIKCVCICIYIYI